MIIWLIARGMHSVTAPFLTVKVTCMSDQLPFHVPPHLPLHPPKALVPAEPVLALQLDGNGRYHKLSAGGLVPAERCWLHLDYSAESAKAWLRRHYCLMCARVAAG